MGTLLVNEMFWSLQGEGTFVGTPSVFIRLQGCSVNCPWCDTQYAASVRESEKLPNESPLVLGKRRPSARWTRASSEWIAEQAIKLAGPGRHAVITGGEPCRQKIFDLTQLLLEQGCSVQIETSGVVPIVCAPGTWVTLSPKARPVVEENWALANEIKLPVDVQADIDRYAEKLAGCDSHKVLLQPVSQGAEATKLCIRTCRERGWRLSLQMHKYLKIQ